MKRLSLFFWKRKKEMQKKQIVAEKIEKRVSDRVALSEFIQITHFNTTLNAEVVDISINGIGVMVDESIALNEVCYLDIDYLKDNTHYAVKCKIVNKTPLLIKKKLRLGLVFEWSSKQQMQEIQSKINNFINK